MTTHTMLRRAVVLACATAAAILMPATAYAQNPMSVSVEYGLGDGSTYWSGCVPPCGCPIREVPMVGTFVLTPTDVNPLFRTFRVDAIAWTINAPEGAKQVTGSGTYRVGGEVAVTQQLTLDLAIGDQPAKHFDSGLVPGGSTFPAIEIGLSDNLACFGEGFVIKAKPRDVPPPLPRHAAFVLKPDASDVELSLFTGGTRSPLVGSLRLFLGDPRVVVFGGDGDVGFSVDAADLIAPDFDPNLPGVTEPLRLIQGPRVHSIGAWNTNTGSITLNLFLMSPDGNLPVPMPLHLKGTLKNRELVLSGNNGNPPDASMAMHIEAVEVMLPPPQIDLWFSTAVGFGASTLTPAPAMAITQVSDGDLLSRRGYVVRTNRQLTARFGIMPIVPDLGLDAVALGPRGSILFSFEQDRGPIWSESMSRWLKPGDLLSDAGFVVATNEQLLARFVRMPPVTDAGLDAAAIGPNGEIFFSTSEPFFSEALGRTVDAGDLLSNRGRVVRTNAELLREFRPDEQSDRPVPSDYGLDAIVLLPQREIWFSTKIGFLDSQLGWISDGDLLSTRGYVVVRNVDLATAFGPIEDTNNFGLDAANVVTRHRRCDFDFDGDVDLADFQVFLACFNGPGRSIAAEVYETTDFDADFDFDGDVDLADFQVFVACFNGPERDPACDE